MRRGGGLVLLLLALGWHAGMGIPHVRNKRQPGGVPQKISGVTNTQPQGTSAKSEAQQPQQGPVQQQTGGSGGGEASKAPQPTATEAKTSAAAVQDKGGDTHTQPHPSADKEHKLKPSQKHQQQDQTQQHGQEQEGPPKEDKSGLPAGHTVPAVPQQPQTQRTTDTPGSGDHASEGSGVGVQPVSSSIVEEQHRDTVQQRTNHLNPDEQASQPPVPEEPWDPHTLVLVTCKSDSLDSGLAKLLHVIPSKAMWDVKVFEKCGARYAQLATSEDARAFNSFVLMDGGKMGREFGTYFDFVAANYDKLRGNYVFMPGNLKHNRLDHIQKMTSFFQHQRQQRAAQHKALIQHSVGHPEPFPNHPTNPIEDGGSFGCSPNGHLRDERHFKIDQYGTELLTPASPRGLAMWAKAHLGMWNDKLASVGTCWAGTFRTTAENLRLRPVDFYKQVGREVNVSDRPESGHYCERMARVMFGDIVAA